MGKTTAVRCQAETTEAPHARKYTTGETRHGAR